MARGAMRTEAPARRGPPRRPGALAVLCIAVLVVNLDNTVLNVALPTLVKKLSATTGQLQWTVDAYAVVFGGCLLVAGSLADRLGRKRLFLAGLAVVGAGSLGAAFSGSVNALIACRAVMGAGAAMTVPSALSILDDLFREPAERERAISLWSGTIGLGIAIGPVAGGALLSRFWWGSVFLVNVPVVLVGIAGTLVLVPSSRSLTPRKPDPVGALLSITALVLVLWAVIEGPDRSWGSGEVVSTGAGGLAILAGFVVWERRSAHPMLPLEYFGRRRFSIALVGLFLGVFALFGGLFVLTQFLQFSLGYSPLGAGLRVLPLSAVVAAGALASRRCVTWAGTRLSAAAALSCIVAGLSEVAATCTATATYARELPGMLLMGLGAGLLLPTCIGSVLGTLAQDDAGVGSATNSTATQVGGAVGVAVVGSALSTRYQHHMHSVLAGRAVPAVGLHDILGSLGGALIVARFVGGILGAELSAAAKAGFADGTRAGMFVAAVVTGGGVVLVLAALPSRAGHPEAKVAMREGLRVEGP